MQNSDSIKNVSYTEHNDKKWEENPLHTLGEPKPLEALAKTAGTPQKVQGEISRSSLKIPASIKQPSEGFFSRIRSLFIKKEAPISLEFIINNYSKRLAELDAKGKEGAIYQGYDQASVLNELDNWLAELSKHPELSDIKKTIEKKVDKWTKEKISTLDDLIKRPVKELTDEEMATFNGMANGFLNLRSKTMQNPQIQMLQEKVVLTNFKYALHKDAQTVTSSINSDQETSELTKKRQTNALKRELVNFSFNSFSIIPFKYDGNNEHHALGGLLNDYESFCNDKTSKGKEISKEAKENLELLKNAYNMTLHVRALIATKGGGLPTQNMEKEFANSIKDQIDHLEPGKRLLIPGGTSYHKMAYEFEKLENGKLQFKIINTALGVNYHYSPSHLRMLDPNAKVQTYLVKDIDPNAVSEEFIGELIKVQLDANLSVLKMFKDQFLPGDTGKIYRSVNVHLIETGKGIKYRSKSPELIHREQHQNVCAKKAYTCWLRENLSQKEIREFKAHATNSLLDRVKEIKVYEEDQRKGERFHAIRNWFRGLSSPMARVGMLLTNQFPTESIIALGEEIADKRQNKANETLEEV